MYSQEIIHYVVFNNFYSQRISVYNNLMVYCFRDRNNSLKQFETFIGKN